MQCWASRPRSRSICNWRTTSSAKPGPGCLSEALRLGLPVITSSGIGTLPQERYNAQWVREMGVGMVLPSMRNIRKGVLQMLERLPEFQARVRELDNQAIFEAPELFARLLADAALQRPSLELTIPSATAAA